MLPPAWGYPRIDRPAARERERRRSPPGERRRGSFSGRPRDARVPSAQARGAAGQAFIDSTAPLSATAIAVQPSRSLLDRVKVIGSPTESVILERRASRRPGGNAS